MRLRTLPSLKDFEPLERNKGYPMFVGNSQPGIFSQTGVFGSGNTIVINEYPYSDPNLAVKNEERMLVWLTDDPLRSDNNRTKALWSIGENSSWAEPTAIDDDGTADFEPEIGLLASGDALATWVNCSQVFGDDADLADLVAASEITVAKYDAALESWQSTQMTNNSHFEHTPHLCAADDDTAMLVWISNPADHIIGSSTEPNQLSIGQSALCWMEHQIGTNLAVLADDLSFLPANPGEGEECTISVIIHNLGDLAVENVQIGFYDGNPEDDGERIGNATLVSLLAGDKSEPVSITWTLPDELSEPKNIYVVVDPDQTTSDRDLSNNTCSQTIIKPDLTIEEIYTQQFSGNKISTVFRLINTGIIPAENIRVELRKNALDGELLSKFQIEKLGKDVFEDKSIVLDRKDCGKVHYVVVDTADTIEEFNEDNNSASVTIPQGFGDVNNDGKVTALDASLVLQHVVGLIELTLAQQDFANVSGDDNVSAYDAALILQYTVELITQFPVQAAPILDVKDENQLLTKIIAELERSSLSPNQRHVLEKLKNLLLRQALPKRTALLQNYPNPFNPETWIPFQLVKLADVSIHIYELDGRRVRQIELGELPAGIYISQDKAGYWNGCNDVGEKVASGVYFYTLQAGEYCATRRMLILK